MYRRRVGYLIAGFLIWIAFGLRPSEAQYTANFQTNIISGVTSNWSGKYIIASNTYSDVLLIQDNGMLINGGGYSGYEPGSTSNSVLIVGTGSVWSNAGGGSLSIGTSGGWNSLLISNAGRVTLSGLSYVGLHSSSSNNTVRITSANSILNALTNLYIGFDGSGNYLIIENGGKVVSYGWSFVSGSYSSNNTVAVSGTGSYWSGVNMYVGGAIGTSNSLIVSNGGQVVNSGFGSVGLFSDANNALVTGTGSVWSIGTDLQIGGFGKRNSVVVSNSAQLVDVTSSIGAYSTASNNSVRVADGGTWQNASLRVGGAGVSNSLVIAGGTVYATNLTVGFSSTVCNNLLELDAGRLAITNATGTGVLELRHGALLINGGTVQADILVITNSCSQLVHTGGTLIVGNVILDPNTFRIVSVTPTGADMLVTWMMGPGATNTLQATAGDGIGGYSTNGFADIFIVTNNPTVGTVTNYVDIGGATNRPARYYRARLVP